jgi:hypothetical protein
MLTKIQNGEQKSRWRQMNTFSLKTRLKQHLPSYFKTLFACKMLTFGRNRGNPRWRQNQNGTQK